MVGIECGWLVEDEEGVGFEMRHAGADVLAVSGVLGEFLERTHAMTINQWHNHRTSYNVYTISELPRGQLCSRRWKE